MRLRRLGELCLGICILIPSAMQAMAQDLKSRTYSPSTGLSGDSLVMEMGTSWADTMDEAELISLLGLDPAAIDPAALNTARMMIDDDEPDDDIPDDEGGGTDPTPTGSGGPLPSPSAIHSRSRWGQWQKVGDINVSDLLDSTWFLMSGPFEEQVVNLLHDATVNIVGPIDLEGFYNININLGDITQSYDRVWVWNTKDRLRLTWTQPGIEISCRADINNWPDRSLRVRTNLTMDIEIVTTGNLSNPTRVVMHNLRFSGTDCWNDGILYRETLNNEVEMSVNRIFQPLPVDLADLMFGALDRKLTSHMTTRTTKVWFEFANQALNFKLDAPWATGPVFDPVLGGSVLQVTK